MSLPLLLTRPQDFEDFIFFTIIDVPAFRNSLRGFKPTTSHDVLESLVKICEQKDKPGRVPLAQTQIAFSREGLNKLNVKDSIRDDYFDKGSMLGRKAELGSTGDWDDVFYEGKVHGVVIVAASGERSRK